MRILGIRSTPPPPLFLLAVGGQYPIFGLGTIGMRGCHIFCGFPKEGKQTCFPGCRFRLRTRALFAVRAEEWQALFSPALVGLGTHRYGERLLQSQYRHISCCLWSGRDIFSCSISIVHERLNQCRVERVLVGFYS